ncbi:MAG: hypothetical protein R3E48_20745 [Burkholderiaceae bacterium]
MADAARQVGQEAIQLHGGMGMTQEMKVSHSFKRCSCWPRFRRCRPSPGSLRARGCRALRGGLRVSGRRAGRVNARPERARYGVGSTSSA